MARIGGTARQRAEQGGGRRSSGGGGRAGTHAAARARRPSSAATTRQARCRIGPLLLGLWRLQPQWRSRPRRLGAGRYPSGCVRRCPANRSYRMGAGQRAGRSLGGHKLAARAHLPERGQGLLLCDLQRRLKHWRSANCKPRLQDSAPMCTAVWARTAPPRIPPCSGSVAAPLEEAGRPHKPPCANPSAGASRARPPGWPPLSRQDGHTNKRRQQPAQGLPARPAVGVAVGGSLRRRRRWWRALASRAAPAALCRHHFCCPSRHRSS